ncbi:hypothetical protein ACQP06_19550 [Nocardia sp. CA-136227]|uniref:hypothetical protein n=1 Tax=Nocardia sp. CA-136227 TaxID=3239979 RepID=UPI003D975E0C
MRSDIRSLVNAPCRPSVSDWWTTVFNDSDFLIMSLIYDPLTVPGTDPNVAPRLASRWESDAGQRNRHECRGRTKRFEVALC